MSYRRIENELQKISFKNVSWKRDQHIVSITLAPQWIVTLKNLETYPFKPPFIFVNERSYTDFLRLCSQRFSQTFRRWYPHTCCLRCESFDCPYRWNVMCNFTKIIEEIQDYAKKKWMIYRMVQMESCFRHYHIPDDVHRQIFSFLDERIVGI